MFTIPTLPLSNDRTTQLLTPSSSGIAEIQRVRAAQDIGRMSMEEGFMCLLKQYGGTHHEGQQIARRKRIFRQWKAHGWTERQVLEDEDFEADERAALSALRDGAQLLSLQESSDDEDDEEEQHEAMNENEEESHSDEDADGSADDEDQVEEQDDRSGENTDD